jgi:hypothetical protein
MTSDSERTRSRRGVLSAVAISTLFGGCLATAERADAPPARAESGASAAETQTDTPTPTITEVPNETEYPVDHPNERERENYGPLLSEQRGAVHPVRSEDEWRQLVTEAPAYDTGEEFIDHSFITRTDFDTETVVVSEQVFNGGEVARLQSVETLSSAHLWLRVKRAGTPVHNGAVYRYVFLRLPIDGRELKRVTVTLGTGSRRTIYAYRSSRCPHQDSSGTPARTDESRDTRRQRSSSTFLLSRHRGER